MSRPVVLIVVGLLFAGFAGFMTFSYLSGQADGVADKKIDYQEVVVAAADISRGDLIEADHVKVVDWPAHAVPENAITDSSQVVGKVARIGLIANEPITDAKLAKNKSSSLLSMLVPEGRRAISLKVNEVTGISGFVAPGSRVDVLMAVRQHDKEPAKSKIILQGVEVLAIDQSIEQIDNKPVTVNTVTLDLTPAQAEVLTLAANEGSLHLSLRNDKDKAMVYTGGHTLPEITSVYGNGRVEVIRGHDVKQVSF